jgi:cysteine synthase A
MPVVAVEPASSPVITPARARLPRHPGIGAGFVPENLHPGSYDRVMAVCEEDAVAATRRLAREEGLLVGISSGANCHAALVVARELGPGKVVATVFSDTGERYLTTDLFRGAGI